jgi:hypothetical protein
VISELYRLLDVNEEQVSLEKKKEEKKSLQLRWLSEVSDKVTRFL